MDMDQAITLMEEVLRGDLERCGVAIKTENKIVALAELERAFAKLDTALDMIRDKVHV
jgi:hypothetical protein